jgi:hypothetical protein
MTQNTSSAVMQQRTEAHDSLEDFPTPPWATRALFEHVIFPSLGLLGRRDVARMQCWEPCANRGYMVKPLEEYFHTVVASDIHDYGMGYPQHDFMMPFSLSTQTVANDWLITNPPFRLADQIIRKALRDAVQAAPAIAAWRLHRARHHAQGRATRPEQAISR